MPRRNRQAQLDRLRQECSLRLRQFLAAAAASEQQLKQLNMPASAESRLELLYLRQREFDACHEYIRACREFGDFLEKQAQPEDG
jgi:hypothetical protein